MKRLKLIFAGSTALSMLFFLFSCGGSETPEASALKIVTERLPSAIFGQDYYFTLAGSGGYQPYEWKISGALPEGIKFDKSSGTFRGKPGPDAASRSFSIELMDRTTEKEDRTPVVKKFTLNIQSGPFIASEKDLLPFQDSY